LRVRSAAGARKSVEINFDNQKIIRNLLSAYDAAVSNAKAKMLDFSVPKEAAEYEAFALRALVDLLESAEKRRAELDREVVWLREQLESLRATLEQSFREILGNAEQREAALEVKCGGCANG
jgi:predicted transcriptional regulator